MWKMKKKRAFYIEITFSTLLLKSIQTVCEGFFFVEKILYFQAVEYPLDFSYVCI